MNLEIYQAAQEKFVWRDLSHFGRFVVSGKDAAALLHHLTTNDVKTLSIGTGCDAALITNKARLLDWLSIFRLGEQEFLVITSPNRRDMFAPHARRFIGFRQDIQIEEITENGALGGVFGADLGEFTAAWKLTDTPLNAVQKVEKDEAVFYVARVRRLPGEGFFLWSDNGAKLRQEIKNITRGEVDGDTYNVLRVEAGLPVTGLEMSEDFNPWEVNLDFAISLHKGCYNGQEIVARLNTYQKIKQNLRGVRLESTCSVPAPLQSSLQSGEKRAGTLTSVVESPRFGVIGLAMVRGDFQAAATSLQVLAAEAPVAATVCDLPFSQP